MKSPNMAPRPPPMTPAITVLPRQDSMPICICAVVSQMPQAVLKDYLWPTYRLHHLLFLLRHASVRVHGRWHGAWTSWKRHGCCLDRQRVCARDVWGKRWVVRL